MTDEQLNTPSADVQASDAAVAESGSDERSEGSSPHWWQRLFNREPVAEGSDDSGDAKTEPTASSTVLSLTPEELERRIQSETDRREAKRAQDARIAARRKLRDEDPFAYAQVEKQEEEVGTANTQVQSFIGSLATHHDKVSIDPVVELLPEAERKRILAMEGVGSGLEGRKTLVTESLKALEKHWRAEGAKEAESKLRRNPAFRKQVFAEFRGQTTEPDLLPGRATSNSADETVSALLRSHYRLG